MTKNLIYLSPPHLETNTVGFISQAIESNYIAPLGPFLDKFENLLEEFLNCNKKAVVLNSGTSAIHLALKLLKIEKGDIVLCQTFNFIGSIAPVSYLGAKPVFVESEKENWNISPFFLEEAIVNCLKNGISPKAIIAVHIYGMPYKVEEVIALGKKYSIPIIEDAAEGLGSSFNNKKCGSFGDLAVYSFNGNKIITTSGGGALIMNSDVLKRRSLFLATQAKDDADYYLHTEIGYNYRMSNISAAIGVAQMEVLKNRVEARRKVHQFYKAFFQNVRGITVFSEPDLRYKSNHWLTCIVVNPKIANCTNQQIKERLAANKIESRLLWKPMHTQPVFKSAPYYGDGFSETLFNNGLCLPSGSNLNVSDLEYIVSIISKCLTRNN